MDTHPPHPTRHPDPSEHSDRPDTRPTPDPTPGGPDFDDLVSAVAGDLPVPITGRHTHHTTDRPRAIGARSVHQLICAYSGPGEAVVDQADGHTLTATGRTGGRHHHPGQFTDMAGLTIGPAAGQCHG